MSDIHLDQIGRKLVSFTDHVSYHSINLEWIHGKNEKDRKKDMFWTNKRDEHDLFIFDAKVRFLSGP